MLKYFNVYDEGTQWNVYDGTETALMKALIEAYVAAVGEPCY